MKECHKRLTIYNSRVRRGCSVLTLGVTELCLVQDVVPDNVAHEVTHCLDRFLDISPVFFNLRPNEFHDGIPSLLTCLQEESWCHFIDQTAQSFDLTFIFLSLHCRDGLLKLVEQVGGYGWRRFLFESLSGHGLPIHLI